MRRREAEGRQRRQAPGCVFVSMVIPPFQAECSAGSGDLPGWVKLVSEIIINDVRIFFYTFPAPCGKMNENSGEKTIGPYRYGLMPCGRETHAVRMRDSCRADAGLMPCG